VFYKHKRLTRYGKTIYVYKLRSMYWKYSTGDKGQKKSDEQIFREMGREDLIAEFKKNQKVKDDPRIMKIGKFTRSTSLDELPQLINIFKGDLSLVGPRPIVKDELHHYDEFDSLFLAIRPGLTGLWQVSGRSDLSYEERVRLDIYYIQNWSLILDIKILLKTVAVVIRKVGSH
ncbi:MAG: sugar transferase, partial [Candidatus Saccharimonadales bacterium]|nr:sugar transferase [Candidatus Saccharimonadales bacterium]